MTTTTSAKLADFEPDPSSFVSLTAGYAKSSHLDIDWAVDFTNKRLVGHVDVTAIAIAAGKCALVLDCRSLTVFSVSIRKDEGGGWVAVDEIQYGADSAHDEVLGRPLVVELPPAPAAGHVYCVRVAYATTPSSSALQWLDKQQTSSGSFPFVFSQCQAIHARSMLPCQDLCQAKVTFTVKVTAPAQLTALASAVRHGDVSITDQSPPPLCQEDTTVLLPEWCDQSAGWSVATFSQKVPVPSYLIALVCGELSSKKIGPISTVWAEPAVVERAAWEFAGTQQFIEVAESLCGPYRFGVFDLLVLPASFPYGGMENPCLTFVTPTLLAGDRSQVAVIAHELSHSWSGNLATNTTWEHFWINEGLTVFVENKIIESVFGKEAASIRNEEGWEHLQQDVKRFGPAHTFTCLCPRLTFGQDPDDSFSSVPYEKGASLFWYIHDLIGQKAMEHVLPDFFNTYAFGNVSSNDVRQFFSSRFPSQLGVVAWEAWFSNPGMPLYKLPVDPAAMSDAVELAETWCHPSDGADPLVASSAAVAAWPSGKKCMFLHTLMGDSSKLSRLTPAKVARMGEAYQFLSTNCEVRCAYITLWLTIAPANEHAKAEAAKLATEQGRMKYTRPMYREMFKADPEMARAVFGANATKYHPICAKMVARDLGLQ